MSALCRCPQEPDLRLWPLGDCGGGHEDTRDLISAASVNIERQRRHHSSIHCMSLAATTYPPPDKASAPRRGYCGAARIIADKNKASWWERVQDPRPSPMYQPEYASTPCPSECVHGSEERRCERSRCRREHRTKPTRKLPLPPLTQKPHVPRSSGRVACGPAGDGVTLGRRRDRYWQVSHA